MTVQEQLIDKSKEAFVLAIEIYNKPSIKYRLEGFSFFYSTITSEGANIITSVHYVKQLESVRGVGKY